MAKFYENMSKDELYEKWAYFEKASAKYSVEVEYYREQLAKSHEILGRVIHQLSEHWDSVRLTAYFPTNNPCNKRTIDNPGGTT